jgi:predicted AAA+ superfamily ATPase
MSLVPRPELKHRVEEALRRSPVVSILGPRQSGKTTLARTIAAGRKAAYFDLEDPRDEARLAEPVLALDRLRGLVVLDEVQRQPALFPLLRVLADRRPLPARFLLLGSASPWLVRGVSESLAGRVTLVDMGGFSLDEVGVGVWRRLWLRGTFPESFLARTAGASAAWRESFVRTFLERDLPQLGARIPAAMLGRFWTMLAHYHGQIWNGTEIAASLGVSHPTTRRYLDLLSGAFVIRQLPPWFENVGKRVVKSPKVYVRDSGLLHTLLGVTDEGALESHPKLGASWEGFVLEQILAWPIERHAFFWATHGGAELDLLVVRGDRRWGFEVKYADAPRMTRSIHVALDDLRLERVFVVHPGERSYPLHERVECLSLADLGRIRRTVTGERRAPGKSRRR